MPDSKSKSRITIPTFGPLPVAVVGCGRMGRIHARVYSEMPQTKLIGVHDANPETASTVAEEFGCKAYKDLDELIDNVFAVTIAVPTGAHAIVAQRCLSRGVACLIEKPL